jgi:transcriptional regulator with XRE-family HTH domain
MATGIQPFYRELGRNIRERRTKKGMTQEELGQLLDPQVTRASIANIETGAQRVLAHTVAQLAYHLEMSVSDLLAPAEAETTDHAEGLHLLNELKQGLKMPTKQVEQLLRKLKK